MTIRVATDMVVVLRYLSRVNLGWGVGGFCLLQLAIASVVF